MFDVAVIGAGAAGMMCAAVAGQRGLRVVLIDHAAKLAEKIRISGGGRCNFTNLGAGPANFLSDNPHFCRSALAGYTPQDFLGLLRRHRVHWHEKHRGQLFCDDSSETIIEVLRAECGQGGVAWRMPCRVDEIARREGGGFTLRTSTGAIDARAVVVATGGMAIPQLGATDYALKVARQFGLKVVEPRPALVPLTFDPAQWQPFAALSGVALEVTLSTGQGKGRAAFLEDLLFTHRGLSGPAILQISSYWKPGEPIVLDLAPGRDLAAELIGAKPGNRQQGQGARGVPGRPAVYPPGPVRPRHPADIELLEAGRAHRAGPGARPRPGRRTDRRQAGQPAAAAYRAGRPVAPAAGRYLAGRGRARRRRGPGRRAPGRRAGPHAAGAGGADP
ncbi:flavoprotein family protein [Bordetella bronchiseptica E013]|nr:flavoprotein family protein [Bordetella bronchiseptica E013]